VGGADWGVGDHCRGKVGQIGEWGARSGRADWGVRSYSGEKGGSDWLVGR
jgi:hypothetical protein